MPDPRRLVAKHHALVTSALTAMLLGLPVAGPLVTATALPAPSQRVTAVVDRVTGQLIDPRTGLKIDPADGVLEPVTGQLIDPVTGTVIPPEHALLGLPILPASEGAGTSARLDETRDEVEGSVGAATPGASEYTQSSATARQAETASEDNPPAEPLIQPPPPAPVTAGSSTNVVGGVVDHVGSGAATVLGVVENVLNNASSRNFEPEARLANDDSTGARPDDRGHPISPSSDESTEKRLAASRDRTTSPAAPDSVRSGRRDEVGAVGSSTDPAEQVAQPGTVTGLAPEGTRQPPWYSATPTLDGLRSQSDLLLRGLALLPQVGIPPEVSSPVVTDDRSTTTSVPLAKAPAATTGLHRLISLVNERLPSWLLATGTAGFILLVLGGAGFISAYRRRHEP